MARNYTRWRGYGRSLLSPSARIGVMNRKPSHWSAAGRQLLRRLRMATLKRPGGRDATSMFLESFQALRAHSGTLNRSCRREPADETRFAKRIHAFTGVATILFMERGAAWRTSAARPFRGAAGDGTRAPSIRGSFLLMFALAILPWLCGCSSVAPYQQRLVSKPNMLFNDSGAFVYQTKMWLQSEPGSMFSGGARAVGCSACGQ